MSDNEKAPTNSLSALFDHAEDFVKKVFDERGEVLPMWICEDKDGETIMISTPMETPTDKDKISMMLRLMFAEKNVVRAIFICEAWTLPESAQITRLDQMPKSIAERPDRVEIVNLTGQDDEGNTLMTYYLIKRDREKPYLTDRKSLVNMPNMGRFANLIPQKAQVRQ